jgi:hypothetical protein
MIRVRLSEFVGDRLQVLPRPSPARPFRGWSSLEMAQWVQDPSPPFALTEAAHSTDDDEMTTEERAAWLWS